MEMAVVDQVEQTMLENWLQNLPMRMTKDFTLQRPTKLPPPLLAGSRLRMSKYTLVAQMPAVVSV